MEKRIVFVGHSVVQVSGAPHLAYDSENSLLDADIIVFSLDLSAYKSYESFQGLRCLDDDSSFELRRQSQHWNSELGIALEHGKTVIVHVNNVSQLSIGTGQKQFAGTGRNARMTRIVTTYEPYSVVPASFGTVVRRSGEVIKPNADLGILATYWHEFGEYSRYECYIDNFKGSALLTTQTGEKTVGGILRQPSWKGTLIFLPPPDLSAAAEGRAESLKAQQRKKSASNSTASGESNRRRAEAAVVRQYIAALIALDRAARSATAYTPPPGWSQQPRYMLLREIQLHKQVTENAEEIKKLQVHRKLLDEALQNAQQLKWLLYEKGKPLERAILTALRVLGYEAENLKDSDSEFDAVMLDPCGARLIGEAEGKDDKAISVDKLDQLDRNIREDFARQDEATATYAKGVLFGNGYRLSTPEDRAECFTAKCLIAAKRSRISVVRTPDLIEIAHYLDDSPDEEFAEACRRVLLENDGEIVVFPGVPVRATAVNPSTDGS